MSRGDQILRQWNLLRALQTRGQGASLQELVRLVQVSERTVQRDLRVLQRLGFPVEYHANLHGKRFWRLPYDFFKEEPLAVTLTEAVSLHLAYKLMTPLVGTYLEEGFCSVLAKVRSVMPAKALDYFAALDEIIYVRGTGRTDFARCGDTIRTLLDASRERVTVRIHYHAIWRGERYMTYVNPYGLVYHEGELFLLAHSHRANAVRIFKVTRIGQARPTKQGFTRPAKFSLVDQFRDSFGIFQAADKPVRIKVRFTGASVALITERVWHESQQLTFRTAQPTLFQSDKRQPNDAVATFRLAGLAEFKRWIKGFGDQAVVLEPAWLRKELSDELFAAAQLYR